MIKHLTLCCCIFLGSLFSQAQDIHYAREVLHELCSEQKQGRGYVNNGDMMAALYLSKQYKRWNVKSFDSTYFQGFTFGVNTFPGAMNMAVDGKQLRPGEDFIVHPESHTTNKLYEIIYVNHALLSNSKKWQKKLDKVSDEQLLVLDAEGCDEETAKLIKALWADPSPFSAAIRLEPKKLTWSIGRKPGTFAGATVIKSAWPAKAKKVLLQIDSKYNYEHTTQNVIGYIEGTEQPDSFIVFTAHYDHLGRMGQNTYFPGANDNASGTSMVLQMAAYYNLRPPKYSVAFICFAGEEAGLLGSLHYVANPLFSLDKIRFVINMDIFGTGDEGITVVNAKTHAKEFEMMRSINDKHQYLTKVKERGQTQNSDHYPFSMHGVPAFFIYTMGGIQAYHDVYDKAETLPLDAYESLFRLLVSFSNQLQE